MKYLLFLLPTFLFAQSQKIHGVVFDDSTHQALSYATVRVEQTDIVTSSNKEGEFILELGSGEYSLLVTYVGYHSNAVKISVPVQSPIRIGLAPAVIQLPEVAVAADTDDPAIEIMRQAIKRREKNYEGMKNYEITGYKKNILFKDDQIAMVDEKVIKHIYEKGKMSKEFVYSTHKTENIKNQQVNINLNIGWALFFASGTFNVGVGKAATQSVFPLADNAMRYYDFKLLQSKVAGKTTTHIIQVIPRTAIEPLVKGKIFIDDDSYALVGADVQTNEGWSIPVVKDFSIKIQQTYANYNGFWIPQYSEFTIGGKISALGGLLSMDRMELSEVYSSSSCRVNGTIPDSIRTAHRSKYGGYTTDTTKRIASALRRWKTKKEPSEDEIVYEPASAPPELSATEIHAVRPLPLTAKEATAFAKLDSSQTLEKLLKPQGALGALSSSSADTTVSVPGRIFGLARRYGMFHNNRVEGISIGAHYDSDKMENDLYYNASASYAFGAALFQGAVGGGVNLGDDHLDRIDVNAWDEIRPWQMWEGVSKTVNTIAFTLTGKDYFNYLRSTGASLGIHKYFTDDSFVKLYFASRRERSVPETSFVSLWKDKRINPRIGEGRTNELQLQCGISSSADDRFGAWGSYEVEMNASLSHPRLGSDFDYRRVSVSGTVTLNTFYSTMFNKPYVKVRIDGAGVSGNYFAIQHLPAPMASLSVYAPFGALKGLQSYELAGEKFVAVQAEHNWQTLPFLLVGLQGLGASGLQVITGASVANAWNTTPYYSQSTKWSPYWEAYVSLGNIFDVLRVDCVRTSRNQTVVRLGVATAF